MTVAFYSPVLVDPTTTAPQHFLSRGTQFSEKIENLTHTPDLTALTVEPIWGVTLHLQNPPHQEGKHTSNPINQEATPPMNPQWYSKQLLARHSIEKTLRHILQDIPLMKRFTQVELCT